MSPSRNTIHARDVPRRQDATVVHTRATYVNRQSGTTQVPPVGTLRSRHPCKTQCPKRPEHPPKRKVVVPSGTCHPRQPSKTPRLKRSEPVREVLGVGTLNVGTLTGKSIELVESMKRRRLSILCLSETKWKGSCAKDLSDGYRLWYHGLDNKHNGVGIILAPGLADDVISVDRVSDRLIGVTACVNGTNVHIISAYFPQTGCKNDEKEAFRECFMDYVQTIPDDRTVIVGTDGNAHVGRRTTDRAHGGKGYGSLNEDGVEFLLLCEALDLTITNTWFKKRDSHLITYASGLNETQIDFILTRRKDLKLVTNCRVWPGENLTSQHRLVVASMLLPVSRARRSARPKPMIRWWKIRHGDNMTQFGRAVATKLPDPAEVDSPWHTEYVWNTVEHLFREEATRLFGIGTGVPPKKQTWWWQETVRSAIAAKKAALKRSKLERTDVAREQYLEAKREARRVVAKAKTEALNELYNEIEDTRANPSLVYKIAKARNRSKQDVKTVKSVRSLEGLILTNPSAITNRWREHYDNLLNEEFPRANISNPTPANTREIGDFTDDEVRAALRKMKQKKALGPDGIPIEAWKALGPTGVRWLRIFFNQVMRHCMMPSSWRVSTLVSVYKNKGDPLDCGSYRPIKLLSHTMKLYERILDRRIRREAPMEDYQCGFRPGCGTTDAIFATRQAIEKRRVKKDPNVHIGFIDLEKAYDRVPHEVLWEAMRWKGVSEKFVAAIQDMYQGTMTVIRTPVGNSPPVPTKVGLHQGSAISPLLFTIVLDYCTRRMTKSPDDTIAYADDIMCRQDTMAELEAALVEWYDALRECGLRVNVKKTEFMSTDDNATVTINGTPLNRVSHFRYLGSEITPSGDNTEEVQWRISRGWAKFRETSGILCDKRIPRKLKGKVYRTAVRPALTYGAETWGPLTSETKKLQVAEMRMLRWMCGYTKLDKKRNDFVRAELGVAPIDQKQQESRLRWAGHMYRHQDELAYQSSNKSVTGPARRGRPKKGWADTIKDDMRDCRITMDDATDRTYWRTRTRKPDPATQQENR